MTITDQTPALWDAYAEACVTGDQAGAQAGVAALEGTGWTEAEMTALEADAETAHRNEQLDAQREREQCPDCGEPQHYVPLGTEGGPAWYHDSIAAAWNCAGTGPQAA